uniref:Zgc:154054 n=1 Tax=Oreochromis niloticus TaxID=8128 RepID=A0A669CTU2_ORENI
MRFYPYKFACLLTFGCFVSVIWIKSIPSDEGSTVMPDLQILYKRLLVAEELGGKVSQDLSSILEQLKNFSKTGNDTYLYSVRNRTGFKETEKQPTGMQTFLQPNIYVFMPHLRHHPGSLVPNVVLGQGRRGVSMVLGIPTVKRDKQSYLVNTLSSLLFGLTASQCQDLLIIVFVAETNSDYVNGVAETIMKNFPNEVQSGLLEVISPSQYYYPNFTSLKETFGDSKERVKWRTKQNLDFSFLMLYAQDKGTFYVQLEDDVVAKSGYYDEMKAYAINEASKPWLYLEFSQLGFIGKMFRTRDLPMITEFFLMFHRDKPIDWLLDHILWVKVCNPEKDDKHCREQKALLKQRYKPSLFQHVGLHSSLPGKLQHLKDKDFGKQTLFKAHNNPPAEGDYILFNFSQPLYASGYLFRSGNIETNGDKFFNTTVEVLPSSVLARHKLANPHYRESGNGFIIVGEFVNGLAEGKIEAALQPVSALRLVVHSDSDVWALLSEILIKI